MATVTLILSSGVSSGEATALATSEAVVQNVAPEQAQQIFQVIDESAITDEQAAEIVDAVQDAPNDIRGVFEDAVSLFQGAFDEYTMLGSTINVGQRRTVVATNLLTTTASAMASIVGASAAPAAPSTPAPNKTGPSPDMAARRNDEEEMEPNGEIAGDGLDWVKRIKIFRYEDGVRVLDWKSFFTKFSYGLMNMGFTLAGSLVVYLTLSGTIQKIAGIATVVAFAAAMWLHMKEPTE